MKLVEVKDSRSVKLFLDCVSTIYRNDDVYVRPLDNELEGVFDPERNVFLKEGKAARWILVNENDNPIGRVAAFINAKKAHTFDQPTGGMGFFECINDQKAAFMLFDQCKKWLNENGMEAMDGPINFGENDRFWGLLVHGFTHPGYGLNYNPPYYQKLFEDYGFEFYFEQLSNHLDITKPLTERFTKIANWVASKPGYSLEHFKLSETERFVSDFVEVYNVAWQFHESFTAIDPVDVRRSLSKLKPILEEKFIWFAYFEGKPIAFMVMIPDVNQILKYLNGKSNWWAKVKFAWYKWRKVINRSRIVILGVLPKYQKSGIESALINNAAKSIYAKGYYKEVELSWVGDFNPKMRALHESAGAILGKKHFTYRKLFQEDSSHKRSTIIARDTKEQALRQEKEKDPQS